MTKQIYYGTAWYPEHWDQSEWAEDLRKMSEAKMNVVRLGEFAWSAMEPREGCVHLDWLEEAVDLAISHGFDVVLCTPTAAPPAWLSVNYPETLAQDPQTELIHRHGARCHYDRCSEIFRTKSEPVIKALADRFGKKEGVIGWQLDNEGLTPSMREATVSAFRHWLKERYNNLETLNRIWTTRYWSQEYSNWNQIESPVANANPGLYLAWHRFLGDSIRDFHQHQINLIRPRIGPAQWITHNFHLMDTFDRFTVCENLDFASYDAYVWEAEEDRFNFITTGLECDRIRGMKNKNFWLMETQPGFINWKGINTCQSPGVTRLMGLHFLGHGSDANLFWQWRPAFCCQEQYHGAVLHAGGQLRPIYEEVKKLGSNINALSKVLKGTVPQYDVSLLDAWQDRLTLYKQPHHKDYSPTHICRSWYGKLRQLGLVVDVMPNLKRRPETKILFAPYIHLVSRESSENLKTFVESGGTLILGPRSGFKDEENCLTRDLQPGELGSWLPFKVREFYAIKRPGIVNSRKGEKFTCKEFVELLEADSKSSEVLSEFDHSMDWVGGQPAIIAGSIGKGRWIYSAMLPDEKALASLFKEAEVPLCRWKIPQGVEYMKRGAEDDRIVHFFLNLNDSATTVDGPLSVIIPKLGAKVILEKVKSNEFQEAISG